MKSESAGHDPNRLVTIVCRTVAATVAVVLAAACDSRSDSDRAPAEWVAAGPAEWAVRLAPASAVDEDGFAALVQLVAWVKATADDDSAANLEWAIEFSAMLNAVAERRRWTGRAEFDSDFRRVYREDVVAAITDGNEQITPRELIVVARKAKDASGVLRAGGRLDDGKQLAAALVVLAERIGRNGGERASAIQSLQAALGAMAAEQLEGFAADEGNEGEAERYAEIARAMEKYGNALTERSRGGP